MRSIRQKKNDTSATQKADEYLKTFDLKSPVHNSSHWPFGLRM